LGYVLFSCCQKRREDKIKKELVDSISDLSFYEYPKMIEKIKNEEEN